MARPAPRRPLRAAAVAVTCTLLGAAAPAEELPLWELGIGAGSLWLPHYRGSDQSHLWLLPVPYAVYRGEWLKADRDGARATLFDGERSELSLSFAASAPTISKDNRARAGMADLAPTVEVGPVWNLTLWRDDAHRKLDLRLPVRAAFTVESPPRHIGWAANPHLNWDQSLAGWNAGLQAGPLFGDRRFHAYYYDVATADATPTRPAYRAGGGYAGWEAIAAMSRQVDDWWLGLFVKSDHIAGSAMADSPLVRERHQWSAGIAVSYIFARSQRLVAVER
jgi:outer membrane scaffolding protein for murein synthesis (MipA/OmpV family)